MGARRSGFTLIELLVVIAIIAILAALLFPVMLRAKKTSQTSACFGNIKQLGAASVMYADDNNGGLLPTVRERNGDKPTYLANYRTWRALLWRYVKNTSVYVCPAMPTEARLWCGRSDVSYDEVQVPVNDVPATYAINNCVSANDSDWQGYYSYKISQYSRPSRILFLTEVKNGIWNTNFGILFRDALLVYAPLYHFNKVNVAFMDGHARTMYLYDTIGNDPSEWMWWDPKVNTMWDQHWGPIAALQAKLKQQWPRNYPPRGGNY